jgi:DNA-binding transcriptional MerR regulator
MEAKQMETKSKGISAAAREVPCAENTLRELDRRGIVKPMRDSAGRRLFGDSDIRAARAYFQAR